MPTETTYNGGSFPNGATPIGIGSAVATPRPMASRPATLATSDGPTLVGIRDNGDGTATVRQRGQNGATRDTVMSVEEARATFGTKPQQVEVLGKAIGKGLSDCVWCRYGKPAIAGAAAGVTLATLGGYEPVRGLVWGGVGGLLYGHVRG